MDLNEKLKKRSLIPPCSIFKIKNYRNDSLSLIILTPLVVNSIWTLGSEQLLVLLSSDSSECSCDTSDDSSFVPTPTAVVVDTVAPRWCPADTTSSIRGSPPPEVRSKPEVVIGGGGGSASAAWLPVPGAYRMRRSLLWERFLRER